MSVYIARTYDYRGAPKRNEYRVLVDRVWPRGISKAELSLDEWAQDLAPSRELRQWFGHDPARWPRFRSAYRKELHAKGAELDRLQQLAEQTDLTLLYSARDPDHNQAVVLGEMLAPD